MIKPDDKVKFSVDGEWFEGTVALMTPPAHQKRNYCTYYIRPDGPTSSNGVNLRLTQLNSGKGLKGLSKESYDLPSNVEIYGNINAYLHYVDVHNKDDIELIKSSTINYSVVTSTKEDGCSCSSCQQFVYMAAPNQADGTFKCYSCKGNPMRNYY